MTLKIILADDHRMFRETLRDALAREPGMEIVAEAGDGTQALECLDRVAADILLLDVALPGLNGMDVARRAMARHPDLRIVALSGYADRLFVEEMLKAGAHGYVVKSAGMDELLLALRSAAAGRIFLSPEVTGAMLGRADTAGTPPPPISVLAPREREVLRCLADGLRSNEIAIELGISPATVDVYRRNIKKKLGLSSIAELTRYAIREGLQSI